MKPKEGARTPLLLPFFLSISFWGCFQFFDDHQKVTLNSFCSLLFSDFLNLIESNICNQICREFKI